MFGMREISEDLKKRLFQITYFEKKFKDNIQNLLWCQIVSIVIFIRFFFRKNCNKLNNTDHSNDSNDSNRLYCAIHLIS